MKQSIQVASFNLMTQLIMLQKLGPQEFSIWAVKMSKEKVSDGGHWRVWFNVFSRTWVLHCYWTQLSSRHEVGICRKLSTTKLLQATFSWPTPKPPAFLAFSQWLLALQPTLGPLGLGWFPKNGFQVFGPSFHEFPLYLTAVSRTSSLNRRIIELLYHLRSFQKPPKVFQNLRCRAGTWYLQW